MRRWTGRDLIGSAALGLALVTGGACNAPGDDHGGTGAAGTTATVTNTTDPTCTSPASLPADARFAPTSGPARAKFRLVAATPEVVIASTGTGLHRSTDGGETWSFVEALRGEPVTAVAALGGDVFVSTQTSVHRTTDGGETWTDASSEACSSPGYLSVQGSHLYALQNGKPFAWDGAKATWKALPDGDNFFDVMESDGNSLYANSLYTPGVYRLRLDDPSAGWTQVAGLPEWGYRAFAFMPGHAFASNANKVFHSVDDGVSWKQISGKFDASDLLVVGDTVFAATLKGLQVSTDKGATWTTELDSLFIHAGFALASDGKHVFAASDGLLRAAPTGGEWSRLHVLADQISLLFPTEKSVFAFSTSGIHRTTDQGASWGDAAIVNGGLYHWGTPFVHHDGKVLGLGGMTSLLASTDDGATFEDVPLPTHVQSGTPSLLASTKKGLFLGVFAGAGSGCSDAQDITMTLYRSTDDGKTWSTGENNLPMSFTDCYGVSTPPAARELVEQGSSLLVATWHDGAYRSIDDGATWTSIGALRGFVSMGNEVFAAGDTGVMKSADDGATWTPTGLDDLHVHTFAVADHLLFASVGDEDAFDGAVWASPDAGATWARVDAGLGARVDALAVLGSRLFAGTREQSVWSLDLGCAP